MTLFHWIPKKKPNLIFMGTTQDELDAWLEQMTPFLQKLFEKHLGKRIPAFEAYGFRIMLADAASELLSEGAQITGPTLVLKWQANVIKRGEELRGRE